MNTEQILEKVKRITADHLGFSPNDFEVSAEFVNDLDADDLDTVEIVMKIEKEFKIQIPDEICSDIRTVKQMVDVVENALKEA